MSELFPLSAGYDAEWARENSMGPNALWLAECLSSRMDLRPGMRVMDLGCGRAISSILLAREFGLQVWATDLWVPATDNLSRVQEAGLEGVVFPIQADARSLPYAHGFFDAVVSLDAYHYFGTDDLYLEYLARFLKTGGQVGIVSPGLRSEPDGQVPAYLHHSYTYGGGHTFHSPGWWRRHWEKTGLVEVRCADEPPGAWEIWLEFARVSPLAREEVEADGGALLTFSRVVAVLS